MTCSSTAASPPAPPTGVPAVRTRAVRCPRRCTRPAARSTGSSGSSSRTPTSTTSGWPGRSSGAAVASCGCTAAPQLDLAKYAEPDEAVDRRTLMLADHGLYGPELTESAEGLLDWMPVMPSIGRPSTAARRRRALHRRRPHVGGRAHPGPLARPRVPVVGHGPRAVLRRSPAAGGLARRSPSSAGFERDPMGSYLDSLERVRGTGARTGAARARPAVPGRGATGGVDRPRASVGAWTQVRDMVEDRDRTVTEITADAVPRRADRRPAPLRDGRDPRRPRVPRGPRRAGADPAPGRGVRVACRRGGAAERQEVAR